MSVRQAEIPHIGILYSNRVQPNFFDEFLAAARNENLSVAIYAREGPEIYNGLELFIPTAIIAYIAKPYFEGFLKEAGKDHYAILRRALVNLAVKASSIKYTLVGSEGKLAKKQSYSLTYSLMADRDDGSRIKFLIQEKIDQAECSEAISAFMEFLDLLYSDQIDDTPIQRLKGARGVGGTLLLAYDFETRRVEVIDPLPERLKKSSD